MSKCAVEFTDTWFSNGYPLRCTPKSIRWKRNTVFLTLLTHDYPQTYPWLHSHFFILPGRTACKSVIERFGYLAVKQTITESRRQQTKQCTRACISLNASRKCCGMDCPRSAHFLLDESVIEISVYYVVRQRYPRKTQITDTRRLSAVCKSLVLRKRIWNSKICK